MLNTTPRYLIDTILKDTEFTNSEKAIWANLLLSYLNEPAQISSVPVGEDSVIFYYKNWSFYYHIKKGKWIFYLDGQGNEDDFYVVCDFLFCLENAIDEWEFYH